MTSTASTPDGKTRFGVGLAGVFGILGAVNALFGPAFAVMYIADGSHFQSLVEQILVFAAMAVYTAVVAAALLYSAALVRTAFTGRWPSVRGLLRSPALPATFVASVGLVALLASFL